MANKDYLQLLFSNNCLYSILENLKDNKGTLFSLLLVNRLSCQHAISYLWASPFDLETNSNKHRLILRTYISCLSEEEKRQLINFQIELEESPIPTIDYPTYIKIFSNQQIQDVVEKFTSSDNNKSRILCKIITNLLINRTKGFTNMEISHSIGLIKIDFTIFPRLSQALTKLTSFEFSGDQFLQQHSQEIYQFFMDLAQYTKNIQKLSILLQSQDGEIIESEITRAITKLIISQTGLASFTIIQYWDVSTCPEIYSAISSQTNSLKTLRIEELTDIQQLVTVLRNCNNLETLQLWKIGTIDSDSLFNLKYPGFRIESIKNLYCDGYYPDYSALTTVALLLRICNPNLKMLCLGHVTREILHDIGCYCSNLSYLSLRIYEEEISHLIRLLSLPHFMTLEHVTLSIIPNLNNNNVINISNTELGFKTSEIIQLANCIPANLRYFGMDFIMNKKDFKFFFQSLKVPLTQLAILENSMICENSLRIILNYAKRVKSLKELIYDQCYEDENFSEKLLEEAKSVIPKIRVLKRGKMSVCKNYFDTQFYES